MPTKIRPHDEHVKSVEPQHNTFLKHSKRQHLIRLDDQFVEIVHKCDRARLRSHETVGFHAHPSDVHIAPELIDLFLNIERFVSALLE